MGANLSRKLSQFEQWDEGRRLLLAMDLIGATVNRRTMSPLKIIFN